MVASGGPSHLNLEGKAEYLKEKKNPSIVVKGNNVTLTYLIISLVNKLLSVLLFDLCLLMDEHECHHTLNYDLVVVVVVVVVIVIKDKTKRE